MTQVLRSTASSELPAGTYLRTESEADPSA